MHTFYEIIHLVDLPFIKCKNRVYTITITDYAEKQFKKINRQYWPKIKEAIFALANEPRPNGYKKLKGREAYLIPMGDYRVIYVKHNGVLTLEVIDLGHRRDIYD